MPEGPASERLDRGGDERLPEAAAPRQELVALIPALRAFALTFCRDGSEAEDLVQETLCKGIANIHRYEPGTRMKSWLFTIMRNTYLSRLRLRAREGPSVDGLPAPGPVRAATMPVQEWSVRRREVVAAVQSLPQQQREVVILITILGMSYTDAAQVCGCAVGTVKSRLNRARRQIVATMGEESAEALLRTDAP